MASESSTLVLAADWTRLSLDMHDLARRAFGVVYACTVSLRIFSTCRVSRVYFAGDEYADAELPGFLRVLNE